MTILETNIEAFAKTGKSFLGDDGNWYGFPYGKTNSSPGYECTKGDRVKIDYVTKGKWNNITEDKFRVLAGTPNVTAAAGGRPDTTNSSKVRWHMYEDADYQIETGKRIARSTALAQAVAYVSAVDQGAKVLEVAADFADFLIDGPAAPEVSVSVPVVTEESAGDDAEF